MGAVAYQALVSPFRADPHRAPLLRAPVVAMSGAGSKAATKFIVVTGGVISGIGKGVTASSIGVCMKMLGGWLSGAGGRGRPPPRPLPVSVRGGSFRRRR